MEEIMETSPMLLTDLQKSLLGMNSFTLKSYLIKWDLLMDSWWLIFPKAWRTGIVR